MKKIIAIVLTLMMCAVIIAGCGGKKQETPAEEPGTRATEQAAQNETTPAPEQTTPAPEETTPAPAPAGQYVILKSDDTHYVINMASYYIVLEHEGDTVTDYYAFMDAGSETVAKATVEEYMSGDVDENVLDVFAEGSYMVITYKKELWEDITVEAMDTLYGDHKVD